MILLMSSYLFFIIFLCVFSGDHKQLFLLESSLFTITYCYILNLCSQLVMITLIRLSACTESLKINGQGVKPRISAQKIANFLSYLIFALETWSMKWKLPWIFSSISRIFYMNKIQSWLISLQQHKLEAEILNRCNGDTSFCTFITSEKT